MSRGILRNIGCRWAEVPNYAKLEIFFDSLAHYSIFFKNYYIFTKYLIFIFWFKVNVKI
jgi:hypothetical protein